MYLEEWNNGYWFTELIIQPAHDKENLCINEKSFRDLQYQVYPTGKQKENIWVKVEESHYDLTASSDTPIGILGMPQDEINELRIQNPPTKQPVLVVKPWFREYLSWSQATT